MTTKIRVGDLDHSIAAKIEAAIEWGTNADPGTGLELQLASGQTFTLKDSGGNPIFQMTEGSPDIPHRHGWKCDR